MRTVIVFAFLLATAVLCAQETETQEKSKLESGWYYSVGAIFNPDYNINDNLRAAGNHRISDAIPAVTVGYGFKWDRYSAEMEIGFAGYWKKKDGYRMAQAPLSIRGAYTVLDDASFSIATGLGVSYVSTDLSIYSKDAVIDMDNLDPGATSGYIRLRNNSWFAGPSLTFAVGKFTKENSRFTIGYDFAISNTQWKTDYGRISNPVRENGNRFYLKMVIPF